MSPITTRHNTTTNTRNKHTTQKHNTTNAPQFNTTINTPSTHRHHHQLPHQVRLQRRRRQPHRRRLQGRPQALPQVGRGPLRLRRVGRRRGGAADGGARADPVRRRGRGCECECGPPGLPPGLSCQRTADTPPYCDHQPLCFQRRQTNNHRHQKQHQRQTARACRRRPTRPTWA